VVLLLFFLAFWLGLSFRYDLLIFAFLIAGILTFIYFRHGRKVFLIGTIIALLGIGYSYIDISHETEQFTGIVYESRDNYFLINSRGERLYCYEKNNPYEIGDFLSIKGNKKELDFSSIESGFDFTSYLYHRGVRSQLFSSHITVRFSNPIRVNAYRNWFLSHFNDSTKGIINSVLFSIQDDSFAIREISDLHLYNYISASGLYLQAFLSFISFLLCFKMREKWAKFIPLCLLVFYSIFTFPRFTVIRVLAFGFARWVNQYAAKKRLSNHSVIGLLGLVFLVLNPYLAYQDSFILGFTIPIFYSFVNKITNQYRKYTRKAMEIGALAIFFLPFGLKYYHGLSILSPLIQIILSPLFLVFGISSMLSFYGIPIFPIINFLARLIVYVSYPLRYLKWELFADQMATWFIVTFYSVYCLFLYYLSIGFRTFYKPLSFITLGLLIINFLPLQGSIRDQVSFINVGQGDACLIREQNRTILIDTGGSIYQDVARECLIPYFKKQKIYDIDYVITTHEDYDHSGALVSLQNNFKVREHIYRQEDFPFTYGGITIQNYNHHTEESSEENEQSLVLGFHFAKRDFLIMGDAPKSIEKNIMAEFSNIPCDILKIGHHGSDTSTSYSFIEYLRPETAIISVGRNSYGHPSDKVLTILNKAGVKIRRTDKEGTINYFNYIFM